MSRTHLALELVGQTQTAFGSTNVYAATVFVPASFANPEDEEGGHLPASTEALTAVSNLTGSEGGPQAVKVTPFILTEANPSYLEVVVHIPAKSFLIAHALGLQWEREATRVVDQLIANRESAHACV